jgi:hypothetical protein
MKSGREAAIRSLAREIKKAVKKNGGEGGTYQWVVCGEVGEEFEIVEKDGGYSKEGKL